MYNPINVTITNLNITADTTAEELKCSAILAQLDKMFQVVSISRRDLPHGTLHVYKDKVSILMKDGNGNNPHFEEFSTLKGAVEYISNIGISWWRLAPIDFKIDGSYFGKCFQDMLVGKYAHVKEDWLETFSGELIPVEPADPEDIAVFVNGKWYTPTHNIYYYTDEGKEHQANIA